MFIIYVCMDLAADRCVSRANRTGIRVYNRGIPVFFFKYNIVLRCTHFATVFYIMCYYILL